MRGAGGEGGKMATREGRAAGEEEQEAEDALPPEEAEALRGHRAAACGFASLDHYLERSMRLRLLPALLCLAFVAVAAWLGSAPVGGAPADEWTEVVPGVLCM